MPEPDPTTRVPDGEERTLFNRQVKNIRRGLQSGTSGQASIQARATAIDSHVSRLWAEAVAAQPELRHGVALIAVGGYGRRELFPFSDIDLLFVIDARKYRVGSPAEATCSAAIRHLSQALWDSGLRLSTMTRRLAECSHFDSANVESTLTLLDARAITGDPALSSALIEAVVPALLKRHGPAIARRLAEITALRHSKWGNTLFHLEPNIKECPGGLRDVHVCGWMARLNAAARNSKPNSLSQPTNDEVNDGKNNEDIEFDEAVQFLSHLRAFLHERHQRDDNLLDWQAQDAAAAAGVGVQDENRHANTIEAAYWMRLYFRHARVIERRAAQKIEDVPGSSIGRLTRLVPIRSRKRSTASSARSTTRIEARHQRFRVERGTILIDSATAESGYPPYDPAHDPEVVLTLFATISEQGVRLSRGAEHRLSQALPYLSNELDEGPGLWRHLAAILCGPAAGEALRTMHVLGLLELLIPEFHGIDALVIRDAYHRYTVDEHTFVLIDTLHDLERVAASSDTRSKSQSTLSSVSASAASSPMAEWQARFGQLLRDLQQPALLYLVALLHDTGKGRSSGDHTRESARLAESLLDRLELDAYERAVVLALISGHLEMSAALRRDVFDLETVRAFAAKVQTHEALRMLTLFTYADIQAVHPAALTPWKAEDLWRLYLATSNVLDRSVDDERLERLERLDHPDHPHSNDRPEPPGDLDRFDGRSNSELIERVTAGLNGRRSEVEYFLLGLPERYLRTRTPEQVRRHVEGASRLAADPVQLDFHYSPNVNQITLITRDRPRLFNTVASVLAAWGMNIVTANAFSNRAGVVVDTFRFTDSFRTLEMNVSERDRFVASICAVVSGEQSLDTLLHGRRRSRRQQPRTTVEARVDFDDHASSHSTLMQVIAQDTAGLLYAISGVLADSDLNVEVALIDTEGEMAIDVFYLTRESAKLDAAAQQALRTSLLEAIDAHSR